ncbi:MAG: MATE family efflux transporter [Acutalibacteraceae bacterium]
MARSRPARAGGIQMTEGSLYKNILLFSVPLIFSQLLQVLFNMADVAVVGKFSSATALGSVGSTSTLVTLFTGFLIGLSNGVNVRVAQYLRRTSGRRHAKLRPHGADFVYAVRRS